MTKSCVIEFHVVTDISPKRHFPRPLAKGASVLFKDNVLPH